MKVYLPNAFCYDNINDKEHCTFWGIFSRDLELPTPRPNKFEYQNKEKESTFNLRRISFGARTYNASIGRFDGVDPLGEKYFNLSQYNYVANNPIFFLDSDGREIGFIKAGEKKDKGTGVTTITYNVNVSVAVMNSSGMSKEEYKKAVNSFKSQLTNSVSGTYNAGDKTKIVFQAGDIDVRSVGSMSNVKESDHLMVVVDDVTGKSSTGGKAGGLGSLGGKIAYVQKGEAAFTAGSMVHELGHNMGLSHNWESGYKDDDGATNYMGYGNIKNQMVGVQLLQTLNKYNANPMQINRGQNYEILGNDYNTNGYSNNQMPLNYNVGRGAKIPRRLKN